MTKKRRSRESSAERGLATEGVREYAEAIVATVREPLLVLDASLRVVKANRFSTRPSGFRPRKRRSG
jgi:hypothetical protein